LRKTICPACKKGLIEPVAVAGRRAPFRNIPDLELPATVSIPTCRSCGEEWFDAKTTEAVQRALEEAYPQALGSKAAVAIEALTQHSTQQELERLLGLSAGYLSKIKSGKEVSSPLAALFLLLADDPKRLADLRRFWRMDGRGKGKPARKAPRLVD